LKELYKEPISYGQLFMYENMNIVIHTDPNTNTVVLLKYTNDLNKIKNINSLLTEMKSFDAFNSFINGAALINNNIFIYGENI
jgi:hypothetical protein